MFKSFNDQNKKNVLFILLTGIFLSIIAFLRFPDLRNEAKYFVVVSEMIEKNNYFVLTYLNELYPDKPPIYFWLLHFLKEYTPKYFYPLALIIGGVIPFILTAFVLYGVFGNYIVSTLFVTTFFAIGASVVLRMDTLMSFFIILSLVNFYKLYITYNTSNTDKKDNSLLLGKSFLYIFLPMGTAILIKGGSGLLTPLVTMIFFLYLTQNFSFLKKIRFWWGLLFVIALFSSWMLLILTEDKGLEYIKLLLGKQTVGRAVNSFAHKRPFYFYLIHLPLTTMPYGIALIFATWTYLRDFKNRFNWSTLEKFCFSWTFAPLFFFSLISGKLDIYLLPIYPGILGLIWCYYLRKKEQKNFKTIHLIPKITLGILILLTLGMPKYNETRTLQNFKSIIEHYESQKRDTPIVLYRFKDGINYIENLNLPYQQIEQVETLKKYIQEHDHDILVLGRVKYLKNLTATIDDLNKVGNNDIATIDVQNNIYNYEILIKNKEFYFLKLKKQG